MDTQSTADTRTKRFLSKRMVWLKLAMSEDSLDRLRRADPSFPKPKKPAVGGLKWREWEVDEWMGK